MSNPNQVQSATPFVVNWTRSYPDRLTRFCSAGIEQFATLEEAVAAANLPFKPYVVDVMIREFNVSANTARVIATRKHSKKLIFKK